MHKAKIYKANALVEASYRLSLYEQRIVLACISQVRRDAPLTDHQLYQVSAQELSDMTGTRLGTVYQNLKQAAKRLFERRVSLHSAPNGSGVPKVRVTRWVQTIEYDEGAGTVSLRFGTDMVPYLSQLTEQFMGYALQDVAKMTSTHGIRLYELLCQWRGTGKREVSVEFLREAFQLENQYNNIRDLKRRVLEPAIAQINAHTPIWVKWDQRKTGRQVSHLIFTFGEKPVEKQGRKKQKKQNTPDERRSVFGIPPQVIEQYAAPGEDWETSALRAQEALSKSR